MKKIISQYRFAVAIAVLLAVAFLIAARYNLWHQPVTARTPVSVTAVPLSTINKPVRMIRTASIESAASLAVNADFSGLVSAIYITEGQTVKAGQPLFKLQASSQPGINQSTGPSEQAQANYENALTEFNRFQKLYEMGGISRRQFETAAARLQEAKATLDSSGNLEQSSGIPADGSATVNAPIDGVVTGLSIAPEKTVQAGQQVLSLGSGQDVEVVAHIEQNDLYLIHLGTPAVIDASSQTIAGQISRIYPQVEANQNPYFLAHVKLANNPEKVLKSGMSVQVRFDTGKTATAPAVPSPAIFQDSQGRSFVYLAINGTAKVQQITVGETLGDLTEITSGLPEQSLIITNNQNDIKDGDAIIVLP